MTELVRVQPASSGPRSAWAPSNSATPLAMTTDAGDVETRVSPLETPIPQWAPPNPIPFPFLQRPPAWKPPYHAMAAFGVLLLVTLGCLVARCKSDGDPATVSVDATSDAPPAPVALSHIAPPIVPPPLSPPEATAVAPAPAPSAALKRCPMPNAAASTPHDDVRRKPATRPVLRTGSVAMPRGS
jgi:hypothetical protein